MRGEVRARRHPQLFAAGLAASIVMVALCVSSGPRDVGPLARTVAVYPSKGSGGFEADLHATLAVDAGCLTATDGTRTWIPVFPKGSFTTTADALTFGASVLPLGTVVSLVGGEVDASSGRIPRACDPELPLWFITQL